MYANEKKQPIFIPRLNSIYKAFFAEWKRPIYGLISQALQSGRLRVPFPFSETAVGPQSCQLDSVRFSKCCRHLFAAHVKVFLRLNTPEGVRLFLFWLEMIMEAREEGLRCTACSFEPSVPALEPGRFLLDQHLIPCLKAADIEAEADRLRRVYQYESIGHPEKINIRLIARRMGLDVRYEPLWDRDRADSILYLDDGYLQIADFSSPSGPVPRWITVPAGTVVLNSYRLSPATEAFAIAHECFHFEQHTLFNRLQQICSNDPAIWRSAGGEIRYGSRFDDPIQVLEWQADRGAYALLMPASETLHLLKSGMNLDPLSRHPAAAFQLAGLALGKLYHQPLYRIRTRLMQLGCGNAAGTLHYADHHLIPPFTLENAVRVPGDTWVLRPGEIEKLRKSDPAFRALLDRGTYVYADGHIVLNGPEFVKSGSGGLELTNWALDHADRCCLRFHREYTQKAPGTYVPGELNYDSEYLEASRIILQDFWQKDCQTMFEAKDLFLKKYSASLWDLEEAVRKPTKISQMKLAEMMHLGIKQLTGHLKNPQGHVCVDFMVALCLNLKLPDWAFELLMEKACLRFDSLDERHKLLQEVMRTRWNDGVEACNQLLKSKSMKPLTWS